MADDFKFSVEQTCGVLSEGKGGWKMELNLVSWSDRPAKYDIRSWSPEHDKMGKGITLTKDELIALKDVLNTLSLD